LSVATAFLFSLSPTDPLPVGKGRLRTAFLLLAVLFPPATVAQDGSAAQKKALACFACHGENDNSTLPQVPILAGQTARYIYLQLVDFKEGRRVEPQMEPFV